MTFPKKIHPPVDDLPYEDEHRIVVRAGMAPL